MNADVATIVADPPWRLEMGKKASVNARCLGGRGKWGDPRQDNSAIKDLQYPTMSVEEISALKVPAAKDAHLYLWTVNRYVEAAYQVARAWGFEPSTLLTWIKSPMGLGLGGTFCNTSEFVLFCRRGNLKAKRRVDRTWFGWPRGEHSQKPEEFQSIVESVSPGPYLEMFARRKRQGWLSFGNEVTSDVRIQSGGGGGFETVATPRATTATLGSPIVWPVALGAVPPIDAGSADRGLTAERGTKS